MPAASCRGRLGRKGSYRSKGSQGRSEGTVPAPSPFLLSVSPGAAQDEPMPRFLHSSSSRQYVTASVPIYRFFRSGGNPARRFRTVRSACPRNVSRTGSGVMRSYRFPTPAGRTLHPVCRGGSAPIPLSFRRTIPHGVPVFPDLCVY